MRLINFLKALFGGRPKLLPPYEIPSPKIRIMPEHVDISSVIDGTVTIVLRHFRHGTHVVTVARSNSLDPFIDDGMLVILEPFDSNVNDLIVGDVIDYALPFIIRDSSGKEFKGAFHRIVEIGKDTQGWWCRTKGDNPVCIIDPVLVRGEYIRRLYRGVLT